MKRALRWVWLALGIGGISTAQTAASAAPEFRLERIPVPGGAELITVFGPLHDPSHRTGAEISDVPLVSVLRDSLGDPSPDNDRLRSVWVLTCSRPGVLQRFAAALPFFYWRAPDGDASPERPPKPVLDLATPMHPVWRGLASNVAQVMVLDPRSALVRASTRAYRANSSDLRQLHLLEALAVLSQLDDDTAARAMLCDSELQDLEARLTLAGRMFGGLVDDARLPEASQRERSRTEQMRGHNWELLRQRAESNGLYFEPLGLSGSYTHALLWIAREELASGAGRHFDGQFLDIDDPWHDPRVLNWKGYVQTRYLDAANRRVVAGTRGAPALHLIPLALYSLEYPKVPLLLVDFRDTGRPKRREMASRALTDTVAGVLGVSRFGNWPYLAASTGWSFFRGRHGVPTNRSSRLRAYSQLRQWLALDESLDPRLREDLLRRLAAMGVNPLEDSVLDQAERARRHYAALLEYACDPSGLAARLDRDRRSELVAYNHGRTARGFLKLASMATLGLYTHRERRGPDLLARLDSERRVAYHIRFLESVVRSSPQTDVVWNLEDVRRSLDALAEPGLPPRCAHLLARVFAQTSDDPTRERCLLALGRLDTRESRAELIRLARDNSVDEHWRTLAGNYLRPPVPATLGDGGQ